MSPVIFKRYGGLSQDHAPTEEEQQYDELLKEADKIEQDLNKISLRYWMPDEMGWFIRNRSRLVVVQGNKQATSIRDEYRALLTTLQQRQKRNA